MLFYLHDDMTNAELLEAAEHLRELRAQQQQQQDEAEEIQVIRDGHREYTTCDGTLTEIPAGSEVFELWHVWRRWYLLVPYRHATYGWPVLWKIRLVRETALEQEAA